MWLSKLRVLLFPLILCLGFVGCSSTSSNEDDNEIIIYAASSLTNAITEVEEVFESTHPEIDVKLNFAGSKTLRSQIENGAQPDLFLSANASHFEALQDQELFQTGGPILKNTMVIILHKDSSVLINGLEDLGSELQLVIAEQAVPAGEYARRIINSFDEINGNGYKDKVLNNVVSEESNVRQVLMKVALGEADAAIVYRTDVIESVKEALRVIEIDEKYNVTAMYYAGVLKHENTENAQTFYNFMYSQEAQKIFEKYGFLSK